MVLGCQWSLVVDSCQWLPLVVICCWLQLVVVERPWLLFVVNGCGWLLLVCRRRSKGLPEWYGALIYCHSGDFTNFLKLVPECPFDLFYHFIMGKIGPKFSHLLTVKAEGAGPPLTVSLTIKRPFFL